MDQLLTESDVHSLKLNEEGLYVDDMPSSGHFANNRQMKCPCNNNYYKSRPCLLAHTKTAVHKKWIETKNANRNNHHTELEAEKKTVREQKILIAQMQRDIAKLEREKRDLLKTIHIISDITRIKEENPQEQQEMEDLMNFE